jgi:hypothetical protein
MTRLQWILTIAAILLLVGFLVWPGWIWGHPIWGPWPKTTTNTAIQPPAGQTPVSQPPAPQPASAGYPLAGQRYSSPQGDEYSAVWDASGWLHQDRLPPEGHRKGHVLAITIEEGRYIFNGVSCRLHLDVSRNGQGANNPQTVGYGNGLAFTVDTADNGQAWGFVVCDQTDVTGFSIQWLGPLP